MKTIGKRPTSIRLIVKIVLAVLVGLGILDDTSVIGILNDPLVAAIGYGLVRMIKQEKQFRTSSAAVPPERQ